MLKKRNLKTKLFLLLFMGLNAHALDWEILNPPNDECVILVHGLFKDKDHMQPLKKYLRSKGFYAVSIEYPTKKASIKDLANEYIPKGIELCREIYPRYTHVVTHSMGGILLRTYLQKNKLRYGSRIVMIAPPNQGSALVNIATQYDLGKWFLGPAGKMLSEDSEFLKGLKPISEPLGIIAGNFSMDPWWSIILEGEDDGKVSVENTKLDEMDDFIIVDSSHKHMMKSKDVQRQVYEFLRYGSFQH